MAKNTKKPWQGRFSKKTHNFVEFFTSSIHFDKRLYLYDIEGSKAHSMMLNKIGIFKAEINFHSEVKANISIKIDKIQSK